MKTGKTFFGRMAFAVVALCSLVAAGADKVVNASSFGWDAEDSTAALQAAFDSGARKVVIDRQAGDWVTRPLFITNSNIEVVLADGVTLKAKRGGFYEKHACLIRIDGWAKNVILRGEGRAMLKMNKADYHDPKQKYPFSEWRHAVSILAAQSVTVKDLTILSSGGDGIYVNGAKGVMLENLVLRDHHRQGMSPISVTDMTVRRCRFNDTFGTAPQCGVDMEPNRANNRFINVVYEDCEFNGNSASGIMFHLAHLNAGTKPLSVTFRRCRSYGNGGSGVSINAGDPVKMEKLGQVKGFVRFEECTFSGNGGAALKLVNHSTDGMDIGFSDCVFDARGSKLEGALLFSNNRYLGDFGGIAMERCTVKIDEGRKVCMFEAQRGIGIGGRFAGVLCVECGGKREMFDLAEFAKKHAPRPELVVRFKAREVEFKKLKAMSANPPEKGAFTPSVRGRFVYVVAVPGAGEYKVRFSSEKVNKKRAETLAGVVQLLDKVGTDLGMFNVPVGDFEYTLKANGANVYRFEVTPRNTAIFRMACDGAAGALLADSPVPLFIGKDVSFYFCVPADAKTVSARISPSEPVQAALIDPSGKTVAEMPYQTTSAAFNVKRGRTASDEVWQLKLIRFKEDMGFQVGVDGIPLVSVDPDGVVGLKTP